MDAGHEDVDEGHQVGVLRRRRHDEPTIILVQQGHAVVVRVQLLQHRNRNTGGRSHEEVSRDLQEALGDPLCLLLSQIEHCRDRVVHHGAQCCGDLFLGERREGASRLTVSLEVGEHQGFSFHRQICFLVLL